MRVLLTGAAGFIGSAVGAALREAGDEVVGVDVMLPEAHGTGHDGPPPGVHPLDVRDAVDDPRWAELLSGVDAVCHQSALVGAGVDAGDLPSYAGHNDLGTAALLAAAAHHDVRALVLASSMVVYGEGRYRCAEHGEQAPPPRERAALEAGDFENHCPACGSSLDWATVPETARLDPRSVYAASKVAQEHYASAWTRMTGARAVGLRYHNVYGPGMPRDTPYSGVAAIFRSSLERGEAPQVFEDGAQMRDFVHVSDVARANVLALHALHEPTQPTQPTVRAEPATDPPPPSGAREEITPAGTFTAFNVSSGRPIAISEVAELVAGGVGHPGQSVRPALTGRFRLGDVRHVVASPERAAAELGFTARIAPEDGLPEFATTPLRG